MKPPRSPLFMAMAMTLLAAAPLILAEPPAKKGDYVSRAEYEVLRQKMQALKARLDKNDQDRATARAEDKEYFKFVEGELKKATEMAEKTLSGSTTFTVTGYATAGFTDREGSNNTFGAGFNPIFLWQITDRLLVQAEAEVELAEDNEGQFNLEFANISYLLNDYITLGAGKFLTPFGFFEENLHPAWINKLPDRPLPYNGHGRLVASQELGLFVRGGVPIGQNSKIKYDFFVSNGPSLRTAGSGASSAAELGTINAHNNDDLNNDKAVGGRIGILPIPQLEFDYSIECAEVNPDGFQTVHLLMQALSLNYKQEIDWLSGTVDVRAEYLWWDMGNATYDAGGTFGGPYTFENDRNGGYVQAAYRPTMVNIKWLKNLEGVFRYAFINESSGAPGRVDTDQYTVGLDYWINPSTVLKFAYELNSPEGENNLNAFLFQLAVGF